MQNLGDLVDVPEDLWTRFWIVLEGEMWLAEWMNKVLR